MSKLVAPILLAISYLCVCPTVVSGAEIRGTVVMDYRGLFEADSRGPTNLVSVALIPDEQQRVVARGSRKEQIEIVENRMRPAFLTVQKGDQVEFINRDLVFHELFSLSPGKPVSAQLGKAGGRERSRLRLTLDQAGTTHFFCRIHNKSYARIDVVETPYLQTVQPGQLFHFVGLVPGRWKLRLASPAAETEWISVTAMTTPPALELTLASRNGGHASGRLKSPAGIAQLYQEPAN